MIRTRVLVVDDSALMRQLLSQLLSADPEIEVLGASSDPIRAWDDIQRLQPDVLTLDVEMPRMDGLEFLEKLMRLRPMPVVMISSLTKHGTEATLRALELGAVDFVAKPSSDLVETLPALRAEIVAKAYSARKRLEFTDNLTPGASPRKLIELLKHRQPPPESVLLSGHEPFLSALISLLISGEPGLSVVMKKGGLCKLTIESLKPGRCASLEWLLTPKQMELMA